MKLKITTYEIQIELFHETELSSVPAPLPLDADRRAEIKRAIAELLLSAALDDDAGPTGGQHDE
jgi:hypothetical protein